MKPSLQRIRKYNETWNARHPGKRKANLRAWELAHAEERRVYKREFFLRKLERLACRSCPKLCELCGRPPDGRGRLHFDHDHETGRFRGWLCHSCNVILGNARDDAALLMKLAAYLEQGGTQAEKEQLDLDLA